MLNSKRKKQVSSFDADKQTPVPSLSNKRRLSDAESSQSHFAKRAKKQHNNDLSYLAYFNQSMHNFTLTVILNKIRSSKKLDVGSKKAKKGLTKQEKAFKWNNDRCCDICWPGSYRDEKLCEKQCQEAANSLICRLSLKKLPKEIEEIVITKLESSIKNASDYHFQFLLVVNSMAIIMKSTAFDVDSDGFYVESSEGYNILDALPSNLQKHPVESFFFEELEKNGIKKATYTNSIKQEEKVVVTTKIMTNTKNMWVCNNIFTKLLDCLVSVLIKLHLAGSRANDYISYITEEKERERKDKKEKSAQRNMPVLSSKRRRELTREEYKKKELKKKLQKMVDKENSAEKEAKAVDDESSCSPPKSLICHKLQAHFRTKYQRDTRNESLQKECKNGSSEWIKEITVLQDKVKKLNDTLRDLYKSDKVVKLMNEIKQIKTNVARVKNDSELKAKLKTAKDQ
ncbi:hypothetical protein BD560DRAFT_425163 [Blakeslea trispora]|nr:hypothetical protein BD560DRAFT_425163 [Blakeslea trispora]